MAGRSSVKSLTVKSVNPDVCVDKTAEGNIAVSIPNADITGSPDDEEDEEITEDDIDSVDDYT